MDEVEEEEELGERTKSRRVVVSSKCLLSPFDKVRTHAEAEARASKGHGSILGLFESGEVEQLVPLLRRESSFDGADGEREESEVDEGDDANGPSKPDLTRK